MKITDLVDIPRNINAGVTNAKQATMLALLGNPRNSYTSDCQPVTHPKLKNLIVTDSVGPFRVTGFGPAVESLKQVCADIKQEEPEVFAALGTAGMLCARLVRGSTHSISNHSWGTAVDLTLAGSLDARGNNKVQFGLVKIFPIFNRHGWFWGAGFRTEDGMHFEVSEEKIRGWNRGGHIGGETQPEPEANLSRGDRGPEVKALQSALLQKGLTVDTDGIFGKDTEAAVKQFQTSQGLGADGVAGPKTKAALGL